MTFLIEKEFHFEKFDDIDQIPRRALPKDDSSLFFSETKKTLDVDISGVLSYLFDRLINVHQSEVDKEFKSDKEVWSKFYKAHFDKFNVSKYLRPVEIETQFENVSFEHSWRNGHINFFEAVNFDLEKLESIRSKVFRWAGQIDELSTSKEDLIYICCPFYPNKMPERRNL